MCIRDRQYTKGAPDVVIGLCTHIYDGDRVVPLTEERRAELVAANKAMADEALRVLALASRTYTEVPSDCSPAALEHDLVSVSYTHLPQSGGMSLSEIASSSCCCARLQGVNTAKEPHIS